MKTKLLVAFLALFFSATSYSQEQTETTDSLVNRLLGEDSFNDIKSQKLLEDMKNELIRDPAVNEQSLTAAEEPKSIVKSYPIQVKMSETESKHLRDKISKYLAWHKQRFNIPGVELLEPKHLDPSLLILRPFRNGDELRVQVVFGEKFQKHVAIEGRRQARRRLLKERLPTTAFVAVAIAAGLVLLYGTLKLLNARSKNRDDYLSVSQVPMV